MIEELRSDIGRFAEIEDTITATAVERLAATLDRDAPALEIGAPIPQGWHGIFGIPAEKTDTLNMDGLPGGVGFLPRVPLQRRVFGGARIKFHHPLRIGDSILCRSKIHDIVEKTGGMGKLVIVVLRHSFSVGHRLCLIEDQDIVHLPVVPETSAARQPAKKAPAGADWKRTVMPEHTLLFRFSALTFNAHRVHYDVSYARDVEGLPGLMVQGKLLAILLMELATSAAPDGLLKEFSYRSVRPVYAGQPFVVEGRLRPDGDGADLWITDSEGAVAQTSKATFP